MIVRRRRAGRDATRLSSHWKARVLQRSPDSANRGVFASWTRVAVRNRYEGSWSEGFEVVQTTGDGYRLRRESDRYLIPGFFTAHDVRIGN